MYATNRAATSTQQHQHTTALWASMRADALTGGAAWLCAYEERWVETSPDDAETEAVFATLALDVLQ